MARQKPLIDALTRSISTAEKTFSLKETVETWYEFLYLLHILNQSKYPLQNKSAINDPQTICRDNSGLLRFARFSEYLSVPNFRLTAFREITLGNCPILIARNRLT